MKKTISILLALVMVISIPLAAGAQATTSQTDYTIVNPYETVDWSTCKTYLANLHTHTTASDGDVTLTDMVRKYYDEGYDILAITDHGVINNGWTTDRKTYPLFNKFRTVSPMSEEDYETITTGADRGGRGMIDITGGIECNFAVVSKTHVNGYFTTYGSGVWGTENDYKTATVEIDKTGGVSVLNHVGDWIDSNHNRARSHEDYYIAYFADIFTTTKSCLGMEIMNGPDNVSKGDRDLWDELLQVVIPTGRNIWAFADDDSEQLDEVGRSFELFPLAENTEANVRQAMENGSFFAASKFDKSDPENELIGNGLVPIVENIIVDNEANTITVVPSAERDCKSIQWVANGVVISEDYTIDLNDYEDLLGCYVRFQLKGEGGATYSQAFELQYEGRVDKEIPDALIPDNLAGTAFKAVYNTIWWSLITFIKEKIDLWLGDLGINVPKNKVFC